MVDPRKFLALAAVAALPLLLPACAAGPSHADVAERFLLEISESEILREGFTEFADDMADDAIAGRCGSAAYEAGLQQGDPSLFYAWRVTCLTYFEDDLTAAQISETKEMIAARAGDAS